MSFDDFLKSGKPTLRPLDIILINSGPGSDNDRSFRIPGFSDEWNHIGIAINAEVLPEYCPIRDEMYLIESSFDPKIWHKGFRIVTLKELIKGRSTVAYCPLRANPWVSRESTFTIRMNVKDVIRQTFKDMELRVKKKNESAGLMSLLYQWLQGLQRYFFKTNNKDPEDPDKKTICSEVVAKIYFELGIFPGINNFHLVKPEQIFTEGQKIQKLDK